MIGITEMTKWTDIMTEKTECKIDKSEPSACAAPNSYARCERLCLIWSNERYLFLFANDLKPYKLRRNT